MHPLDELKRFVDIGGEQNLPTWWNSSLLFLVAVLAGGAALQAQSSQQKTAWWVIAAGVTYLSLDETGQLHERLAVPMQAIGVQVPTYTWLVLGSVVAITGAIVLVTAGRYLSRRTSRRLLVALACYGTGAVVVEAVNGLLRTLGSDHLFSLGLMIEEGLEMFACVIAAAAVLDVILGAEQPSPHCAEPATR